MIPNLLKYRGNQFKPHLQRGISLLETSKNETDWTGHQNKENFQVPEASLAQSLVKKQWLLDFQDQAEVAVCAKNRVNQSKVLVLPARERSGRSAATPLRQWNQFSPGALIQLMQIKKRLVDLAALRITGPKRQRSLVKWRTRHRKRRINRRQIEGEQISGLQDPWKATVGHDLRVLNQTICLLYTSDAADE